MSYIHLHVDWIIVIHIKVCYIKKPDTIRKMITGENVAALSALHDRDQSADVI